MTQQNQEKGNVEVELGNSEIIMELIRSNREEIEKRIVDAIEVDSIGQIVRQVLNDVLSRAIIDCIGDISKGVVEAIVNAIDYSKLEEKASEVITNMVGDIARNKTRDIGHFAIRDAVGEKCKELAEQSVHEVMAEVDIEEVKQQLRAQAKMVLGQDMNELLRQEIGLLYDRLKELSGEVNILRNEIRNRPSK